ncbi:DUF4883 family protein [Clostridium sediminicola]|uniref:DUF4883 family protein n=1 Tax=Clostridium sediminicola TaxID=3114879 RepID=UPI0031F1F8F3
MKKGSLIILISISIFFIFFLVNKELHKKKTYDFYYTNLLAKNLTFYEDADIKALNINFYKTKELSEDDIDTIKDFMKKISQNSFSKKPVDLPESPVYKLFFTFDNGEKYVINVYSSKYISVFPWDGDLSMDYANMSNVPTRYNIYNLCKYIFESR